MARAFIFSVLLISLVTVAYATSESTELYDNRYDYVDIDGILSNDRIRNQYYKCYTNTGPCLTPDAKFFKEVFPEALATQCKRCTEKQKEKFEKIVVFYLEYQPEQWKRFVANLVHGQKT